MIGAQGVVTLGFIRTSEEIRCIGRGMAVNTLREEIANGGKRERGPSKASRKGDQGANLEDSRMSFPRATMSTNLPGTIILLALHGMRSEGGTWQFTLVYGYSSQCDSEPAVSRSFVSYLGRWKYSLSDLLHSLTDAFS